MSIDPEDASSSETYVPKVCVFRFFSSFCLFIRPPLNHTTCASTHDDILNDNSDELKLRRGNHPDQPRQLSMVLYLAGLTTSGSSSSLLSSIIIIMIRIRIFTMITSVETVSEGQISEPTTAQYRTVPLRPYNVTFDPLSIGIVLIMIIMLQLS